MSTIRNTIMRRVYYSFAISIATHRMFWQGITLGASVALFGRLTHVASIINNVLSIPLTNIPSYVAQAFIKAAGSGEFLTVAVVLVMTSLSVSATTRFISLASGRFAFATA